MAEASPSIAKDVTEVSAHPFPVKAESFVMLMRS
jgi:hypothetical protein